MLSEAQQTLSNRFARPGAKWESLDHRVGHGGAPLLHGPAAIFECDAYQRHDAGDHVLFLAAIRRFTAHPERRPLVFAKGRYATLHPSEEAPPLWPPDIHH